MQARIARVVRNIDKLSIGLVTLYDFAAFPIMSNAISMGVDGFSPRPSPDASEPIVLNELIISIAKLGPFISSHQKNPVNTVNLTNSAKNSPMSALRKAIMPNVQTIEITTNVQNNQVACPEIVPDQPELALRNLSDTSFKTPPLSIAAAAD